MPRGTASRARRPGRGPARPPPARTPARRRPTSENGWGMPGGGVGTPSCSVTASNTTLSQGFRSRGPQTADRDPAAGAQDAPDLACGERRIRDEHQPFAAEHDVVASASGSSMCSRSRTRAETLARPRSAMRGRRRSPSSRRRSPRCTTSPPGRDERCGVEPRAAGAARQLEHALAGRGPGQLEHPLGDVPAAGVDVAPGGPPTRRRRRTTSGAAAAAERIVGRGWRRWCSMSGSFLY